MSFTLLRSARLAATLALTFGFAHVAHADAHFDRTLTVHGTVDLTVSTGAGSVRINESHDNVVHISAEVHANHGMFNSESEAAAREIAAHPPIEQSGDTIRLGKPGDSLEKKVSIEYNISMPHDAILALRTGSGDVEVNGVGRSVQADTGSGSVRVRGVSGAAVLRTGSGDIELQGVGSGDLRADTGSGSIRLRGVHGGIQARTGSGDIEIEGALTADSSLTSGSGSVRISLPSESRLNLEASTGSGTIRVGQQFGFSGDGERHHASGMIHGGGPRLHIQTGSGDVEVR